MLRYQFTRSYHLLKLISHKNMLTHSRNVPLLNPCLYGMNNLPIKRLYSDQRKFDEVIIDFDHVKQSVNNKNILIVDVREPEEVKEHGKIPNSVNIPLGSVTTALSTMSDKEFTKLYGRSKPSENTEIIFYCMIGKRSGMAQQNAFDLGYKNVKNYLGSWTDWANKS